MCLLGNGRPGDRFRAIEVPQRSFAQHGHGPFVSEWLHRSMHGGWNTGASTGAHAPATYACRDTRATVSCHVACQVDHSKLHLTPGEAATLLAELPPSFHTRFEDAFRIQVAYTARLPTTGLSTGLERVCVCVRAVGPLRRYRAPGCRAPCDRTRLYSGAFDSARGAGVIQK